MTLLNLLETKLDELIKNKNKNIESKEIFDNITNIFNFFELTNEEIENVINQIKNLTKEEKDLLITLQTLSENSKKNIITMGLDNNQKNILFTLLNKINLFKQEVKNNNKAKIEEHINTIKIIIEKFKNSIDILEKEELEYLYEIIETSNLTHKEKFDILKEIALNTYNKYTILSLENEEYAIVNNITNEQELIDIFKLYNLDFNKYNQKWKDYILKKGNIENIREILEYITNKPELSNLTNIRNQEILIKVLVHSNIELINTVIKIAADNNIKDIVYTQLTILYPTIKEQKRVNKQAEHSEITYTSGAANYFIENVDLFKKLNLNIKDIYSTCSTLFTKNPKTVKNALHDLELYGYSLFKNNNEFKEAISCLKLTDVSTKIDCAIENDCYEYCKQNLSRLTSNLHRLKLAKKYFKKENPSSEFNPFIIYKNKSSRLAMHSEFTNNNSKYGCTVEETFELYDATNINIKNYELYEGIINTFENNTITEKTKDHPFIKALDNSIYFDPKKEYEYKFDNIIISRYKVLRFLETFIKLPNIEINENTLLYIITKNSMLDQSEINTIQNIVTKLIETRSIKL